MACINLIAWDNNRGMSHDLRLLQQTLEALGHEVAFADAGPKRKHGAWKARWQRLQMTLRWLLSGGRQPRQLDVNIFLEHVRPSYLKLARRNVLIPNPEWLSQRDLRWLHRFDAVFTKTQSATSTLLGLGHPATYIGFLSIDRHDPQAAREPVFLHLAGASRMKGTERMLAVWRRHPEWPRLIVQQSPATAVASEGQAPQNLDHRVGYPRDIAEIAQLQNSCSYHLCLSEAEGWGHYIVEAMGCGAVVLTCDGQPMNELVRPDRGVLVQAQDVGAQNAARRYLFDETSLEAAVERVIAMPDAERSAMQQRARSWFLANNEGFKARLADALQPLL
ncbi:glycosyltransferase [Dyella flagellata]|uniref:Glycosyl transferase n=1 Tax=Dyella flagellata TaxID=1867833 RepID=A0ABQ5X9E5_9GAMM|nr:glycosyltransferase [Dyella flagellata]GLQ88218.1 glycosyl transferase [Dyella flagellata]